MRVKKTEQQSNKPESDHFHNQGIVWFLGEFYYFSYLRRVEQTQWGLHYASASSVKVYWAEAALQEGKYNFLPSAEGLTAF